MGDPVPQEAAQCFARVVAVPVLQLLKSIVEVVSLAPDGVFLKRICEQIVVVPFPHVVEQGVARCVAVPVPVIVKETVEVVSFGFA